MYYCPIAPHMSDERTVASDDSGYPPPSQLPYYPIDHDGGGEYTEPVDAAYTTLPPPNTKSSTSNLYNSSACSASRAYEQNERDWALEKVDAVEHLHSSYTGFNDTYLSAASPRIVPLDQKSDLESKRQSELHEPTSGRLLRYEMGTPQTARQLPGVASILFRGSNGQGLRPEEEEVRLGYPSRSLYRERSPSPVVKEEESDALPSTESGRTDPQSLSLPTSLPLRLVTWTSPDCREARRFEVFKRVDSLQPCAEADTGTDNKNNSTAKPSFGAATPQASTKSPGPGDDLEEIRRRNVRSNPSPRDGLAGPYTKAKSSIPDPRPRLPKKESVDSICETSIAKSLHESSLPDWSASQCDSPESGPSSSGNHDIKQPNAHGDKHKARRNRKIEKRQRRNNEDDDRPTSFPVAAGWDRDEKAGIPCIYGEFHPSKYDSDQCRITKYEEFSHLLKHLKQPIHHNLYDCKEYISNVHPRPPPSTPVPSIQSLPPPASSSNTPCPVDNAQNAIPPAGTRPISEVLFVALCKLCWIEFHDQESLDAHKNAGCRKYDPGKLRKWQAMYNAFCVKLFQRRFPSIPLSQETGLLHATPRAAASHNDSPRHDYAHATDQDRSHYACVSQSAFHAIVGELFQKIDDLSCRLSSEALSEHSTFRPHTGTVEERNRVLQGMARVGDEVSTSFGFVGMHSVTMDIPPANRPGGSGIAFAPSTDLAIDPGVKPPTSPRDSGIGSFVSQSGSLRAQNNSSESQNGVSESLAETSESRSEMLTSQQNIASETTERTVDIRPYLDPDHSNYCACDGCIAFHVYRGNRNLPSGGPQVQSATGNDVSFSDYFIEQSEY